MRLLWKIRYIDTQTRTFGNRFLTIDTETLDAPVRAAIELCDSLNPEVMGRDIIPFRKFFTPANLADNNIQSIFSRHQRARVISIPSYFENENGNEISSKQLGPLLTGNPDAILVPPGMPADSVQHYGKNQKSLDYDKISLSEETINILSLFTYDLRELKNTEFFCNGETILTMQKGSKSVTRTSTSKAQLREFVAVFRKLYMQKEPANLQKVVDEFLIAVPTHPLATLLANIKEGYVKRLASPPSIFSFKGSTVITAKTVIDAYLNNWFAHQPNEKGKRKFERCLEGIEKDAGKLFGIFLHILEELSNDIVNAGEIISDFFEGYRRFYKLPPDILSEVDSGTAGLGTLKKKETRRERLIFDAIDKLAKHLWEDAGRPEGGHGAFTDEAQAQLKKIGGIK